MTQAKLQLALEGALPLPLDVVTQRLAFMGRPGSGKSYAAKLLFELLVRAGVQAIPIDVVGIWWGVRLDADGRRPGLAVPIFGGLHGDVPLEPHACALVADLVVDRDLTAVLDISQMDDSDQTRFATDFGRQFFQRKKAKPSPVMLFLEECQELIPQNPMKDETKKLHVYQRICKLGRNYGIGISLISQRPQDVNKKAINLTELMLAFQTVAPTERRTIRDWMVEVGVGGDEDLNTLLPKLKVGEARVYSPAWLSVQKTVHIAASLTYDSSSTPKVGARRVEPKALSPIDIEQIAASMRDVVERAKADDPKLLRARIAELERQAKATEAKAAALPSAHEGALARLTPALPQPAPRVERVEVPVLQEADIKRLEATVATITDAGRRLDGVADELSAAWSDYMTTATAITKALQARQAHAAAASRPESPVRSAAPRPAPPRAAPAAPAGPRRALAMVEGPGGTSRLAMVESSPDAAELPTADRSVLEALIQFPEGRTRQQLTVLTGYARSSRNAAILRLQGRALVTDDGTRIVATPAGAVAVPDARPLPTGQALQEFWLERLEKGERAILEVLIRAAQPVTRDELTEATGYQRSSRNNLLQKLSAKDLVVEAGQGFVRASDDLF